MITQTEVELYVRINPNYEFVEFVGTIPGITELRTTIFLPETGVDMSIFDDATQHIYAPDGDLFLPIMSQLGRKNFTRIVKNDDYLKPNDGSMCPCCNQV